MPSPADIPQRPPNRWSWALPHVQAVLAARRPRRVLLVSGTRDDLELPDRADCEVTRAALVPPRSTRAVACRSGDLPFQARVFDLVIALQVLSDGLEPALGELLRVLEPGGQLLVLGAGRWSLARRRDPQLRQAPTIRLAGLSRALRRRSFIIELRRGQGCCGLRIATGEGWRRPLLGFSDAIMVAARHRGRGPIITPLRFARPQAVNTRGPVLDGLNREATS